MVLGDDNWVIFKDAGGYEIFSLWPHSDLAEVCCFDEHKDMGAKPQAISLDSFIKIAYQVWFLTACTLEYSMTINEKGLLMKADH